MSHIAEYRLDSQPTYVLQTICRVYKNVGSIELHYDGYGDSGETTDLIIDGESKDYLYDYDYLIDALWTILTNYVAGFENNEGGFGILFVEIEEGYARIEHNERYVEINYNEYELSVNSPHNE